ncbi:MAG: methenyltetrahydromethanopterin cyclohydrolase, partial [Clostridiaceae bacterium]
DELIAMDRVNSSTLYGSVARYVVDCEDEEIERILPHMAFSGTKHNKKTFAELYDAAERDIFKMDTDVHKVARIEMTNLKTGKTFFAGALDAEMLMKSYFQNTL